MLLLAMESGRFLSCLAAVGSTGGILRLACNSFLGGNVSSVSKVEVDTSGLVGVLLEGCLDIVLQFHKVCLQYR